jgi:DMSO/TMAO reductase YedYZ molybdopterin-dependent catalytic subunit
LTISLINQFSVPDCCSYLFSTVSCTPSSIATRETKSFFSFPRERWGFTTKWTGIRVTDLLNLSGLKPEAKYIAFKTADGYSTSLPLEYLQENRLLLAFGINDLTLPPERGFPLQLVAKDRYGYKWAKWVTEIEATDEDRLGYWESRGYSNRARVGDLPFG